MWNMKTKKQKFERIAKPISITLSIALFVTGCASVVPTTPLKTIEHSNQMLGTIVISPVKLQGSSVPDKNYGSLFRSKHKVKWKGSAYQQILAKKIRESSIAGKVIVLQHDHDLHSSSKCNKRGSCFEWSFKTQTLPGPVID